MRASHHIYDHRSAVALWSNAEEYGWSEYDKLPGLLKTYSEAGSGVAITEQNRLIQSLDSEDGPLSKVIRVHQLNVPIAILTGLKRNSDMHKAQFHDAIYDERNCRFSKSEFITKFYATCEAFSRQISAVMFMNIKNFDQGLWDSMICAITYEVVYQKFTKLLRLQGILLSTGDDIVNATQDDPLWGVGLTVDDPDVSIPTRWKDNNGMPGANILGWALMSARGALYAHPRFRHSEVEISHYGEWLPGNMVRHVAGASSGMITVEFAVPGEDKLRMKHMHKRSTMLRLRDPDTGLLVTSEEYVKHCALDREGP